jgi:hypothetical protein
VEAINEDVFDLDELEEEELVDNEAVDALDGSPSASIVSSTFLSAIREVSLPDYLTYVVLGYFLFLL